MSKSQFTFVLQQPEKDFNYYLVLKDGDDIGTIEDGVFLNVQGIKFSPEELVDLGREIKELNSSGGSKA